MKKLIALLILAPMLALAQFIMLPMPAISNQAGWWTYTNPPATNAVWQAFWAVNTNFGLASSYLGSNGTVTVTNSIAVKAFSLTSTNAAAAVIWNSNNAAIYIRGTNGVDKLVVSW